MTYSVGELARRTGLTARTLHHYESLGLLRPGRRATSGYRAYDEASLAQLHSVLAYRYLGMPLRQIATLMAANSPPLKDLLLRQVAVVEERIARHQRLLHALTSCTKALNDGSPGLSDELLGLITARRLCEETMTPDEHGIIARTRAALSEADLSKLKSAMSALIRKFEGQRVRGADPASAGVLALARRLGTMRRYIADDDNPEFRAKIRSIAAQTPGLLAAQRITPELADYIRRAREALERAEALPVPASRSARVKKRSP